MCLWHTFVVWKEVYTGERTTFGYGDQESITTELIKKGWYTHTLQRYSIITKNTVTSFARRGYDLRSSYYVK